MKTTWNYSVSAVAAAVLIGLGGCAGMSQQDKGTAIGAGVGGVAGNVLGGGLLGTAAGAVVGGVVGHEVTKPK
jgi:osmotically inducible lipoprotein OsmB